MPSKIPMIYGAEYIAQAEMAITTTAPSTGAVITLDNSLAGNLGGCQGYQCYAVVTAGPTTAATARLYYAGSYNSTMTDINFDTGSLSVAIPAGLTGKFCLGTIYNPDKYSQVKLGAESFAFTASLLVVPILSEAQ